MKLLILFFIGLLVGAMGATMVVNTLRQRDAYARGLMDVMQHDFVYLREELRSKHCDEAMSAHALAQLRALAPDTDSAIFPDSIADAPFREFSSRLTTALDAAASSAPADCAALAPHVQSIGKACDECHQRYR